MARREPEDGYEEVSFGQDAPPRSTSRLLIGVACACLVAGFLAGGRSGVLTPSDAADDATLSVPVTAGSVDNVEGAEDGAEFELAVFNSGEQEVEVSVLDLGGWGAELLDSPSVTIASENWEEVRFTARADCADPLPGDVSAFRLQANTSTEQYEGDVPVSDVDALVQYHEAVCATPDMIRPSQLAGVWLVEKVYGPWAVLEGVHLMRFNPDGTFVVDPEGGLFSGDQGVWGTYRLHGELLTIRTEGGYASCPRDATTTARAAIRPDESLSLAWLRGTCPESNGDVWIARRVLRNVGLPSRPPGVEPASPG